MPDPTETPWPSWLAGLTPEVRIARIVNAVAACYRDAACCIAGAVHQAGADWHCTVFPASQFLCRLLDEARAGAGPVHAGSAEARLLRQVGGTARDALDGAGLTPRVALQVIRGGVETWERERPGPPAEPAGAPGVAEAEPQPEPEPVPPLPGGDYGRMELPGFRSHTGWWTPGVLAGQSVMVCTDREGIAVAEYIPGPASRFVRLPVPVAAKPADDDWSDVRAALTAGRDEDDDPDDYVAHAPGCHRPDYCDGECMEGPAF